MLTRRVEKTGKFEENDENAQNQALTGLNKVRNERISALEHHFSDDFEALAVDKSSL
jgi:hypothetical protein